MFRSSVLQILPVLGSISGFDIVDTRNTSKYFGVRSCGYFNYVNYFGGSVFPIIMVLAVFRLLVLLILPMLAVFLRFVRQREGVLGVVQVFILRGTGYLRCLCCRYLLYSEFVLLVLLVLAVLRPSVLLILRIPSVFRPLVLAILRVVAVPNISNTRNILGA